jgi:hypothetical protein
VVIAGGLRAELLEMDRQLLRRVEDGAVINPVNVMLTFTERRRRRDASPPSLTVLDD